MRFSLGTFVLLILLLSSIYATVMLNKPWHDAGTTGLSQIQFNAMRISDVSPDGTKRVGWMHLPDSPYNFSDSRSGADAIGIFENKPNGALLYALVNERAIFANYKSDMEIELVNYAVINMDKSDLSIIYTCHTFRRRFADSPWGNATRPEVLLGAACVVLLLFVLVRNLRRKSANAGTK